MFLKRIFQLMLIILLPGIVAAQVTTSTITGTVKTSDGKAVSGATIRAVHVPTGSVYSTVSNDAGLYNLPNLRIGGPYTITSDYAGLKSYKIEDVNTVLGTPISLDIVMNDKTQDLNNVTVTAASKSGIISSLRNGTSTVLSSRVIQAVPTVNRNIQDYARLMPQARSASTASNGNGAGISFGGQNNRYNQFSIDGANASDGFGLAGSGTNGGQANINPISMEAIQEIQIVMSPYDVTQGGFTGGGINAVTKSGTNTIHGAVYGMIQPRGLIGKSVQYNDGITRNSIPSGFKNYTYGASLGGAIIKNKLFYYVNYEHFEKETPLAFDPTVTGSGSKVNADTMAWIRQNMIKNYNYDPGTYGAINNKNQSNSVFARIDWNINDKNKLVVRYNHVEGYLDVLSRSAVTGTFANSGYRINNNTNSFVAELNSSFSSNASNVLRFTYSRVKDFRTTSAFPSVSVTNYNPATATNISYAFGAEYSSGVNALNQDIYTLTDNLTLYKGNHTLTFGTDNQLFKSTNWFLQGYYGSYTYGLFSSSTANLSGFINNTPGYMSGYNVGFSTSTDPADKAPATVKAAQLAVYGQDVWAVNDRFKLTYGLRIDMPVFIGKPGDNAAFNSAFASFGVKTSQMPKTQPLFSPRVGFNWDVNGNKQTQLRGGAGLFTGRVPFVWISNNFTNTGLASSSYNPVPSGTSAANAAKILQTAGIQFPTVSQMTGPHLGAYLPTAGNATPTINVVDKNFKYPQVFRANIALDQKLNWWGLIGTVEAVYTKTLNNANYTNLNQNQNPNGDTTVTVGGITRPYWRSSNVNTAYGQVLKLSNTSKGDAYSFTLQIQKPYENGWSGSIAYTYGHSTSLNDLTSSVALSNWRSPITANGLNNPQLSTSNFNLGSRIVGFVTKEFKYAKNASTAFTLIYTGQSGQRLSYVEGTILGDGGTTLAYIPKTAAEANFVDIANGKTASQQWADFQTFVGSNSYLQKKTGQIAERNGDKMPWENHFDFKISQNFMVGRNKLEFYWTILNVGNLLNKHAGWSYSAISTTADGFFTANSSLFSVVNSGNPGTVKKDGVVVTSPTVYNPAFQFNINNMTNLHGQYKPFQVSDFTSRWSSQLGVRYSF